jgi:hypothetical protein
MVVEERVRRRRERREKRERADDRISDFGFRIFKKKQKKEIPL